ncbi:MAG: AAA family ATPase [Pseudomonadota bacterium]
MDFRDWSFWQILLSLGGAIVTLAGLITVGYRFGHWQGHLKNPGKLQLDEAIRNRELAEKQLAEANAKRAQMSNDIRRYRTLKEALVEGDRDLWNSHKPQPYETYNEDVLRRDMQVVTVMNLKGGVGKTTMATNLAAYFDQYKDKRVLVVDLDYQGSATATLLRMMGFEQLPDQNAINVFATSGRLASPAETVRPVQNPLRKTDFVPCSYPFAAIENRQMVKWLFQELDHDPRFRLSEVLFSEAFRDRYDVVIIDAPPRLSLGAINALTASRTVIIPTLPDLMSTEAVANFAGQLQGIAGVLNPSLDKLLIAMNQTRYTEMLDSEERAINRVMKDLDFWPGIARQIPQNIPSRVVFSRASVEQSLAWILDDSNDVRIRDLFISFGDFIAEEIGIS